MLDEKSADATSWCGRSLGAVADAELREVEGLIDGYLRRGYLPIYREQGWVVLRRGAPWSRAAAWVGCRPPLLDLEQPLGVAATSSAMCRARRDETSRLRTA